MREKTPTPNTISFYLKKSRAVHNRAVGQRITTDRKPFRTVFTGTDKTRKRAMSFKE